MSWLDIALLCAVALAMGLAGRKVHRDRKRGKTCCGDCARTGITIESGDANALCVSLPDLARGKSFEITVVQYRRKELHVAPCKAPKMILLHVNDLSVNTTRDTLFKHWSGLDFMHPPDVILQDTRQWHPCIPYTASRHPLRQDKP